MKLRAMVWMLPAALTLAAPALAQDAVAQSQKKLLSIRAAKADAYRKLAEVIKGVQVTSDTFVRDFVTESDTIRADLDNFIKGVRLGEPRCYEDLTCEVPAEVTVAKLIEELKTIHERHYKGDKVKGKDIEELKKYIKKDIIQVVGMGAPREDLPPGLPEGVMEELKGPTALSQATIPPIWKQFKANERLLAKRAAQLDAMRQLIERIIGLRINSETIVRDFVAEKDEIYATARGTLIGATERRIYWHSDEPVVEVTMEVPVEQVIETIKTLHSRSIQGDRIKGTDIEEISRQIKSKTFEATGMGVPRPQAIQAYNSQVPTEQKIPGWAVQPTIRMTGNGVPPEDKAGTPQGKLLAARAAELDAKRKLAEHIQGLQITSETLVRDFVAEHDEIRAHIDAILVGSTVEETKFTEETAEVTVSVPGMQVWEIVYQRIRVTRLK